MDNFDEEEIAFLSGCIEREQSNEQVLDKVELTSSLRSAWPNTTFKKYSSNMNIYPGNNFLHQISSISGPYSSPSNTVINGPSFGEYQRVLQKPIAISQNIANGPTNLHPVSTLPGPYPGPYRSPSNRVINGPSFGQQQITISQNVSRPVPPSTCESERATGVTSVSYRNFLPSRCITGSYRSPFGTNFNQNTMGGTLRSTTKHLAQGSITGERNALDTKSTPVTISDSPIRENTPVQYKRTCCLQRKKRARESESEVEILHSDIFYKKKKAKLDENESGLSSIKSSIKCQAKWDGVYYVDGRMIIPTGQDLLMDQLLLNYPSGNESELPSFQNSGTGLEGATLQNPIIL